MNNTSLEREVHISPYEKRFRELVKLYPAIDFAKLLDELLEVNTETTQEFFANTIGCSRKTLQRYRTGSHRSRDIVIRIAIGFKLTYDAFLEFLGYSGFTLIENNPNDKKLLSILKANSCIDEDTMENLLDVLDENEF